jgi:hypothetical protein
MDEMTPFITPTNPSTVPKSVSNAMGFIVHECLVICGRVS